MVPPKQSELTQILQSILSDKIDEHKTLDGTFELVHEELLNIATHLMQSERPDHTLQPTALVHEAYGRLVDATRIEWESRAHFFAIAARAMRQVLVHHTRRRGRAKRVGGWKCVTLDERLGLEEKPEIDIIVLDEILERLARMDERMVRIVEYRVFSGMSMKEIAEVLGVTRQTVHNEWRVAKMLIVHELKSGGKEKV
jgi:RNA polymerase sigma factor (TIGR02999 family)